MGIFKRMIAAGKYRLSEFIQSKMNVYSTLRNINHIRRGDYVFFLSQPSHAQNIIQIISEIPRDKFLIVKNYSKSIDDGISTDINCIRWYGFDLKPLKPKILITPHVSFPRKMTLANTKIIHLIISLMPLENVYLEDAFDDPDYIAVATNYQIQSFLKLASKRPDKLKGKHLLPIGYPKIDSIIKRNYNNPSSFESRKNVVLLAPTHRYSGNENVALANSEISSLIAAILRLDYNLIYRPHPVSFNSDSDFIREIEKRYAQDAKFTLDDSIDYFETYSHSDVMITDYSGTGLTFAWGFNKRAIFYTSEQNSVFGEDIYFAQNTTELEQVLKRIIKNQKQNLLETAENLIFNLGSSSEVFFNYLCLIKAGKLDSGWISLS